MIFQVAVLLDNRKCAQFTQEGMEGVERKNPNRPVSLISLEARQGVDRAVLRGLCYKRFAADITLDCEQMPPTGALLKSGNLVLGILSERKRCWPECKLLQDKLPCPLIDGVRYARVDNPGKLCQGDSLACIDPS
jgi:hypothetical protein